MKKSKEWENEWEMEQEWELEWERPSSLAKFVIFIEVRVVCNKGATPR